MRKPLGPCRPIGVCGYCKVITYSGIGDRANACRNCWQRESRKLAKGQHVRLAIKPSENEIAQSLNGKPYYPEGERVIVTTTEVGTTRKLRAVNLFWRNHRSCNFCGRSFKLMNPNQKYCRRECSVEGRRKAQRELMRRKRGLLLAV